MTEIDKKQAPTKFLWVDLEMTGLNVQNDVILEVAALVTDVNFNVLASYEAIVQHDPAAVRAAMDKDVWWDSYPENRDDLLAKMVDGTPEVQVEQQLINFVTANFGQEPAVLAGNSIHNDRNFIKRWWPKFDQTLHYRMLDVSAWKVFMQARYGVEFEKAGVHRALDDIEASIAELQFYIDWLDEHSAGDTPE